MWSSHVVSTPNTIMVILGLFIFNSDAQRRFGQAPKSKTQLSQLNTRKRSKRVPLYFRRSDMISPLVRTNCRYSSKGHCIY